MIVTGEQIVALHTRSGAQIGQITAGSQASVKWRREADQISTCTVTAPVREELWAAPWVHWLSVWDSSGEELYWTGPVLRCERDRDTVTITARDAALFTTRTRTPITKSWESSPLTEIGGELWDEMIGLHNLPTPTPILLPDPDGHRFDFACQADAGTLDAVIGQLTGLGMRWSVVAGQPVIGPAYRAPIAALGEHDFTGAGATLVRDGSGMANDVLLRCADEHIRVRRPASVMLQAVVDRDTVSGVSNAERAAREYLRRTATVRDTLTFSGSQLHPDAPITARQLIPTARITVEAYGMISVMEIRSVEVSCTPAGSVVAVGLESVDDATPELLEKP